MGGLARCPPHGPFQCRFSAALHGAGRQSRSATLVESRAFPRKLAGLLLAAGMAAAATAAAAPARAGTQYYAFRDHYPELLPVPGGGPGAVLVNVVTTQVCDGQSNPARQRTEVALGGGVSKLVSHAVGWCPDAHVPARPRPARGSSCGTAAPSSATSAGSWTVASGSSSRGPGTAPGTA